MLLKEISCVLAETTRSQAYIQALVKNGLQPSKCLILSRSNGDVPRKDSGGQFGDEPYFDVTESVIETMNQYHIDYEAINSTDINSGLVLAALEHLPQRYIIYSGYGGSILGAELFRLEKKWIHVHAGILPQYRGSTTAYYSMLECGRLGATAIFLNEKIDEGDIIVEREFPPPEKMGSIDYVYEPYIRSCVLLEAVQVYVKKGEFPARKQKPEETETYFIIHPVLKHIAILGNNDSEELDHGSDTVYRN